MDNGSDLKFEIRDFKSGAPAFAGRRELAVGASSTEAQMSLDFDRRDAFRLLPPAQQQWAWEWFQALVQTGLLYNGDWKKKLGGRELRAGERVFYIAQKDDAIRYLAATRGVSRPYVYRRRAELLQLLAYLDDCRRRGKHPDTFVVSKIFPSRAKHRNIDDSKSKIQNFRKRPDAGISKSIPDTAKEWIVARHGQGARPERGDNDGYHPTAAQTLYDYELFREFLIASGNDADAMGYPTIAIRTLRRFLNSPEIASDPALLLAREGSAYFQDRVAPHIIRSKAGLFAHDWWVSDHTPADVWVRWSLDPQVIYRPYLTFWLDVRTHYPLSFVLSPIGSSLTIMQSFLIALESFRVKPQIVYCDNGKDYRSLVLNGNAPFPMQANDGFDDRQLGLFRRLGIDPRHALPSRSNKRSGQRDCHARSKPIESWFGGWLKRFDLGLPGACGNAPDAKPDKLIAELAKPEQHLLLDVEYEQMLAGYLRDRYILKHKVREMGMTPAEALQHFSRARWGLPESTITLEEIGYYALAPAEPRRVWNSMISIRIGGGSHSYTHAALARLNGQDVSVKWNPANPDEVYLYFEGAPLGLAHRVKELPWGAAPDAIGEQMALQRSALKAARETQIARLAVPVPSQRQYGQIRELLATNLKSEIGNLTTSQSEIGNLSNAALAHGTQLEHMKKRARGGQRPAGKRSISIEIAQSMIAAEEGE